MPDSSQITSPIPSDQPGAEARPAAPRVAEPLAQPLRQVDELTDADPVAVAAWCRRPIDRASRSRRLSRAFRSSAAACAARPRSHNAAIRHEEVSAWSESSSRGTARRVQIPAGHTVLLEQGTEAYVTQSLGGSYTLQVPSYGGLFRIAGRDGDAIGKEIIQETVAAAGRRSRAAGLVRPEDLLRPGDPGEHRRPRDWSTTCGSLPAMPAARWT